MRGGMSGDSQPCNSYLLAPSHTPTLQLPLFGLYFQQDGCCLPWHKRENANRVTLKLLQKVLKDRTCTSIPEKSWSHRQRTNLYVLKEGWREPCKDK